MSSPNGDASSANDRIHRAELDRDAITALDLWPRLIDLLLEHDIGHSKEDTWEVPQ